MFLLKYLKWNQVVSSYKVTSEKNENIKHQIETLETLSPGYCIGSDNDGSDGMANGSNIKYKYEKGRKKEEILGHTINIKSTYRLSFGSVGLTELIT